MANSFNITEGSGKSIGSNTTSSVEYQKIQLGNGADASYAVISDTNPLQVGGTAAACVGKAEDAAHTSGDVGVMALGKRLDTLTSSSNSAGTVADYCTLNVDAAGRLYTNNKPLAGDGVSSFRSTALGNTGIAPVTAAATLWSFTAINGEASTVVVKLYDKATAATSSDTPVATFSIAAGATVRDEFPRGMAFANGISVRASMTTTPYADNSTGATTGGLVHCHASYT